MNKTNKKIKPILVLDGEELSPVTNNPEEIEIIVKEKKNNKTLRQKIIKGKRFSKKKPLVFIFEEDINNNTNLNSNNNTNLNSNNNINNNTNLNSNNKTKKTKKSRLKTPVDFIIMDSPKSKSKEIKRYNEIFIDILEQLYTIMLKHGEIFRAKAYQKAEETIMDYPNDITSPEQLKGLPGIGPTIIEKLNEYVNTGSLKVIEREKTNPVNILTEVYGIGPKKANELVKEGITSIEMLQAKQNEVLTNVQKIGLRYYDDIQKKIPRSEIEQYNNIFQKAFDKIKNNNSAMEIVGSYRRGAQQSGDIDVIITSDSISIYSNFIDLLLKEGIIIEILSRGTNKCLVIAKLNAASVARRVDFLYTTREEFPFAVLYFTGSKIFNTVMRHKALKQGYTFNEHGMYKLDSKKKKGEQVDNKFSDEKSIFNFLNLKYKEPQERKDGRAVQDLDQNLVEQKTVSLDSLSPLSNIININTNTNKSNNKTLKKKTILNGNLKKETKKEKIIELFKKMGISVLENLDEKDLTDLLEYANNSYYNDIPVLNDNQYDIIKEYIENKYPTNKAVLAVGAPVVKNKVTLPYEMGSMDKIKPDTGALENWTQKYPGPYILSCKLDGVSGLYTTEGNDAKLYTRGDGKVGQDISHFIPYFDLPKEKNIVIRGEFMISKEDFELHLKDKYANPRNLVAGIINQKKVDPNIKYVKFIAYELIKPELIPSQQLSFIENLKLEVVLYNIQKNISNDVLSKYLIDWRQNYKYEIDGIIVTDDHLFVRQSGNPLHSFAFKMVLSDQTAEAKVVDVIWTPSKDGYLKPRVRIEPVKLGGVTIEYATGINAAFIDSNKIGIGALIQIIRSGDVIPKIIGVSIPAETSKMPNVPYKWNNTHVDVLLQDEQLLDDPTVKEKNITGFFKGIGVDGLSSGNVSRIIKAGYDTIPKIVHMKKEDFLKVDGFKDKLADKIYNGIKEKLNNANLIVIMANSNIFGRGLNEKKINLIMKEIPDILTSSYSKEEKINKVSQVKGMAKKSAEAFVEKIDEFNLFLKELEIEIEIDNVVNNESIIVDNTNPLFEKNIVITGSRDKSILEYLKKVGANLSSNVNKNTFVVIAKTKDEDTGKANDANKLNIPILTIEEFSDKYMK
jgi:DNA ligase (NAD+)